MRVHRGFLGWGVFFVVFGLVPLSVRLGWVSGASLSSAWQLWPLFLVGAGVGLILRRTPFEPVDCIGKQDVEMVDSRCGSRRNGTGRNGVD